LDAGSSSSRPPGIFVAGRTSATNRTGLRRSVPRDGNPCFRSNLRGGFRAGVGQPVTTASWYWRLQSHPADLFGRIGSLAGGDSGGDPRQTRIFGTRATWELTGDLPASCILSCDRYDWLAVQHTAPARGWTVWLAALQTDVTARLVNPALAIFADSTPRP